MNKNIENFSRLVCISALLSTTEREAGIPCNKPSTNKYILTVSGARLARVTLPAKMLTVDFKNARFVL